MRVCASITLATWLMSSGILLAQDRVLLFQSPPPGEPQRPFQISEVTVEQRGRGWNVRRIIELPRHYTSHEPVIVAGGQWAVWLTLDETQRSTVLVGYEIETHRASVVGQRRFALGALLLADPSRPRVFVVEGQQIVVIDASLRERVIPVPVTIPIGLAAFGGSRLAVSRSEWTASGRNDELILIDVESGAVEEILRLPGATTRIALTRDGGRLYRAYWSGLEPRIDLMALPGGHPIARSSNGGPAHLFTLDERRGVLVFDQGTALVALDAHTLRPVGELAPGMFRERREFTLNETYSGEAILVRSAQFAPGYMGNCNGPRLDVFDGGTFEHTNRIELTGRCVAVVPIPPAPTR